MSRGAANRPGCFRRGRERIADGHGPRAPKKLSWNGDSAVRLVGARKVFGDVIAVDGTDLEIEADEFFTMVGQDPVIPPGVTAGAAGAAVARLTHSLPPCCWTL